MFLAVDYRPIDDLIPYARNARTHPEAQVALSAGSIREYGFTNSLLVVGENGIIADNKRAEQAGWDRELLAGAWRPAGHGGRPD